MTQNSRLDHQRQDVEQRDIRPKLFVLDSGRVTPSSVLQSKPISQYTSIRLDQQRGDMLNQMNENGQTSSRIFDNPLEGV